MTVREFSERLSFDYNLIDEHIPNNKFKRIFPLDPNDTQVTNNNEKLSDFYDRL